MGVIYGDQDACYLSRLEAERHRLSGTLVEYYRLIRGENVDPLYNEPSDDPLYGGSPSGDSKKWVYDIKKEFYCSFVYEEKDNREPEVREEGLLVRYDATAYVAQYNWDLVFSGIDPKEGDVTYVHNEWFSIVKAGKGGNVIDTATVTGWELRLQKISSFDPSRKVNR